MAELDARKGMVLALEEALSDNLNYFLVEISRPCSDNIGGLLGEIMGGIDPKRAYKAKTLLTHWKKQLEDEKEEIIPIINEETFDIYHDIADAAITSLKKVNEKGGLETNSSTINVANQIGFCIMLNRMHSGIPTKSLPDTQKAMVDYMQNTVLETKSYCKHKAINTYNMLAVDFPEYEELAEALKERCNKCPFYSNGVEA